MAEITTAMVKELRQATNAGVLDCKKALAEVDGDFEGAVEILRKKGLSAAAKKSDRATSEGVIGSYVHSNSKIASMVELNCETDFVARTDQFQQLARDLAMHVAAASPLYISREDVPEEDVEREKALYEAQAAESGKPAAIVEKIAEGKLDKWYSEVCLLEQSFVKDNDMIIQSLIVDAIATLGENIQIGNFARLQIGS